MDSIMMTFKDDGIIKNWLMVLYGCKKSYILNGCFYIGKNGWY